MTNSKKTAASAVAAASAAHARAVRWGTPADVAAARVALDEAKFEAAIQKAVDSAPPLTDEMRGRVARLLAGGDR